MDTEIKVTELPAFKAFRLDAILPNGHSVGYINISLKGTVADLCDLCVKDSYIYLWPHFMPALLSIKRKRNYQNQGIGSRLLATAIEHSKSKGCSQMKGWMHGDKVRLERFYRSFGFEINGISIALDLDNMHNKAFKTDSQRSAFSV
ncbi:GNAT family N-acetyltransferase [Vibrio parahaemolyticus]|uniref:GNAT family N-acetyltransferase n=1 Tax=Vibrio parahaemolyticus TaxID=670 RepID=UPI00226B1E1E|nr:GNAT family N-acetyltransferase [Vibrio parahaemolyticus]MCX8809278.1 GNAT family N-acetyltransferase [Vibrio parahaemolyticus]